MQPTFDFSARPVAPASPTLAPAERRRLSRQNAAILARLQAGPATRRELTDIALNVTARVSELRDAGFDVRVVERNTVTGRTVYRLVGER
jgi:hypothetical protein